MPELRWCNTSVDGDITVHSKPTVTDTLEYANKALKDPEEFNFCKSDERIQDLCLVKELITQK
tara:strand:+ start:336 stop:524 length:189 start_codon:yes stop_codon:yes gene_type:complete